VKKRYPRPMLAIAMAATRRTLSVREEE